MPRANISMVLAVSLFCSLSGFAQSPIGSFPSASDLMPLVSAAVHSGPLGTTYSYTLQNDAMSKQAAILLAIKYESGIETSLTGTPSRWDSADKVGEALLIGWVALSGGEVQPGASQPGFMILADGLPGITDCFVVGDVPIDKLPVFDNNSAPDGVPGSSILENSVRLRVIGPMAPPKQFTPTSFLKMVISYKEEAIQLGWIKNQGIEISLDAKLNAALAALNRGQTATAKNNLNALLKEVDAQTGKQLSPEAVALLKFNTQYLLGKIQ